MGCLDSYYRHGIHDLIKNKFRQIPILRYKTINQFDQKDSKAVERINRIIAKYALDTTPSEFVKDQKNVFRLATQPLPK